MPPYPRSDRFVELTAPPPIQARRRDGGEQGEDDDARQKGSSQNLFRIVR